MHRRRPQQQAEGPWTVSVWCSKVTCSPAKPKPGAQRTKGQELSGGADLLATADSAQPHLLSHLTEQSFHIQGCRNRDRETSWLGPNATPYQAVGPSAQKRPHKNGNCPPHLEVQRAPQKAGINGTSTYGTAEQWSRLSPWEPQRQPRSWLLGDVAAIRCHLYRMKSAVTESCQAVHQDHRPGQRHVALHSCSALCWSQGTKGPSSL